MMGSEVERFCYLDLISITLRLAMREKREMFSIVKSVCFSFALSLSLFCGMRQ